MAYPTTSNNLPANHADGQTITSANGNAVEADVNAITLKIGTGASTPTAGQVLTGTGTGTSSWQPQAGSQTHRSITASATVTSSDDVLDVNATGGAVTVTLLAAATRFRPLWIRKTDASANTVTVAAATSETINHAASLILATQDSVAFLISDQSSAWGNYA